MLLVEECAAWTHSPGGQRCANKIIRQGRKAWTGFCAISQHPSTDFAVLEDEFIDQRLCLGFNAAMAEATLRWCGRDVDRHPALLNYVANTSPVSWSTTATTRSTPATAPSSRAARVRRGSSTNSAASARSGSSRRRPRAGRRYDTNPLRERVRQRRSAQGVSR